MQLVRYTVVAASAGAVDFALFALFAGYFGYHYLVVGAITFSLATVLNYVLSVRHVFASGVRFTPMMEFGAVFTVSTIGLGLNQLALFTGIGLLGTHLLLTKLMANLVSFTWNYLARKHYIFHDHRADPPDIRPLSELTFSERFNFLVTNRVPRRWLTLWVGRFSRIANPVVKTVSLALWKACVDDLRLHEARKTEFRSMHDCFTRELKPDARPISEAPDVLVSPCDAVVGEFGDLTARHAIQAKGFPYAIDELVGDRSLVDDAGLTGFITLRLKSSMYHRFHAPDDCRIDHVQYISGDTWNVNPIALKMVERLFCRNERAVIPLRVTGGETVVIVAVAAILVASMRIRGLPEPLNLSYRGPNRIDCDLARFRGEELGHFEQGSTLVLLTPRAFTVHEQVETGEIIRMGQPLMQRLNNSAKKR